MFTSAEEILLEAKKNKKLATEKGMTCGGIYYNPPVEAPDEHAYTSIFNTKKK